MLKKLLFGMSLTAVCAVGKAQTVTSAPYEPEFIGETNLLCIAGTDTVVMPLEKSRGRIKSKAGASLYLTGIGSVKTRIHVPGIASSCVAKPNCTYRLIVKAADNKQDPNSFIQLIRFESKKKERRCEIGQINTFKGSSSGIEHSLIIKLSVTGRVLICWLLILVPVNTVSSNRIRMQRMRKY